MLIFGIGKGILTNLLLTSPKSLKKHTVLSFLGIMKDGKAHSDAGCLSNTPQFAQSLHFFYDGVLVDFGHWESSAMIG
jgi:hypothetical protein